MRPITDELVHEVTAKIVDQCRPEKIIAFGSYGRDEHRRESDLDLVVLFEEKDTARGYGRGEDGHFLE